jgi:CubicO group peptidase (beta-lactamase class C family)
MRTVVLGSFLGWLMAGAAAAVPAAPAALDAPTAAAIDRLLAPWSAADGPGCAVGVARNGEQLLAKGYGLADVANDVPITAATVFPVGSNSKQFTAMSILLLAEDGRLSLDDDVRKFLPELPVEEHPVLVRHLLHHTSGIRDYQALRYLSGLNVKPIQIDDVYGLMIRKRGLDFPPGSQFSYSNGGYVLLRLIVERVSGTTLDRFASERIFAPLGMTHTRWSEDWERVVPHRASVYEGSRESGLRQMNQPPLMGSGGIFTTVGDFLLWDENTYHNRLGKGLPQLIADWRRPGRLDDGSPIGYGDGIFIDTYHGRPIEWHGGTGPGYVADVLRFPREHLAVVAFCNGVVDSRDLTRKIADLVLPPVAMSAGPTAPTPRRGAYVTLPPAMLAAYAGEYLNPKSFTLIQLRAANDGLTLTAGRLQLHLRATAERELWTFQPDYGLQYRFEPRPEGGYTVRLFEEGKETAHYDPLPPAPPPGDLAPFLGRFANEALAVLYEVARHGNDLILRSPLQVYGKLLWLGQNRFLVATEWFSLILTFEPPTGTESGAFRLDVQDGPSGFRFARSRPCAE